MIDFVALDFSSRSDLMHFVQRVEAAPSAVSVFRLNHAQGGPGNVLFVSPYAPLFDVAV